VKTDSFQFLIFSFSIFINRCFLFRLFSCTCRFYSWETIIHEFWITKLLKIIKSSLSQFRRIHQHHRIKLHRIQYHKTDLYREKMYQDNTSNIKITYIQLYNHSPPFANQVIPQRLAKFIFFMLKHTKFI
jgi:hypothetical protein